MANKQKLVDMIQAEIGGSKADAAKCLDGVLSAFTKALENGEDISLIGFGKFSVVERSARSGINPKTKEKIQIPASKTVKFSVGKDLKEKL